MTKTNTPIRRKIKGVVVSDKMDKTVVVRVDRYVKHPKYGKYYTITKRYKAHDENDAYKVGDVVIIEESKPISKDKTFIVLEKVAARE
ncbi:MAG: small subunit ribosomal protein [Patescibacteria group bacterium]|nr:small subunit ribosomal protein [Patescibacteria group bacterium]